MRLDFSLLRVRIEHWCDEREYELSICHFGGLNRDGALLGLCRMDGGWWWDVLYLHTLYDVLTDLIARALGWIP